jgi:hypothetical protein
MEPSGEYSGPLLQRATTPSVTPRAATKAAQNGPSATRVTLELSHAAGLKLVDTNACDQYYSKKCCGQKIHGMG